MEQNNAQVGQEAMPENNQSTPKQTEPLPSDRQSDNMESLLQQEGVGLDFLPSQGEIRTGVIARIGTNEILVSIGTKSEGVISGRELEVIPADEFRSFTTGTEIPVYVVNPEDQNGNVVLSYMRAREERDWQRAESLRDAGETYSGKVIGFNKGGLIVPIGGLRGFVPASQISFLRRIDAGAETPEQRWGKMVNEPIQVRVLEVDRERRRLILSERLALQETRETLKDRLLDELQEGAIRTGRVTSLADFGAFVNIDGADGLVHLSEVSWEHIQHPNEVLKVGQEVQVKVISMDRERKRIGLSIRQLLPDPWIKKVEGLKEGQLIEGTITHLTKFGAFARLGEDLEGLIHVSELSEQRINHPKEVVKEGDVVTLRIIRIDPERRRIGLSLRKVDSPAYADLDWKMELAGELIEAQSETHIKETPPPAAEALPEAQEATTPEVTLEEASAPAVKEEAMAPEGTPEEPLATAAKEDALAPEVTPEEASAPAAKEEAIAPEGTPEEPSTPEAIEEAPTPETEASGPAVESNPPEVGGDMPASETISENTEAT